MRRIIYNMMICCAAAWLLAACSKEDDLPGGQTGGDGNSIILDISSGALPVSRATVPAEGAEVAVSHIDVLIFNDTDAKTKVWSDRVNASANETGRITLPVKRSSFMANEKYWVYLIANSTHTEKDFENLADLNALKAMTQEDENIHLTGKDLEGVPGTFLMDGIAYPEGNDEPAVAAPVVLYDGSQGNDTQLAVTLRRAAAKIVVTINRGQDVTFDSQGIGYYLRNMPYTTSVVAGAGGAAKLKNTAQTSGGYLEWTADKITVTAYMYAHAWDNGSSMEQEVRLVMNIPITYLKDADPQLRPENYYQIPVCSGKVLERNTCYKVTATVNAPGAENPSTPVTLTDLKYTVENWIDETVNVGGGDRPTFLVLNRYDLEMHNKEDDRTSLIFTSSSEVTAQITRIYYIDKFGREQNLEKRYPNNPNNNEWGVNVKVSSGWYPTTEWRSHGDILITPDRGLNGKLDVHSDLPGNNTIRYIEVRVTNEDGNERTVTIEQYPLEYITNIQGWYSYRDDFKKTDSQPTTYEHKGDRISGIALATRNISTWNGEYEYITGQSYNGRNSDAFFFSKVAKLRNDGSGQSNLYSYHYDYIGRRQENSYDEYNGRMYTIVLTGTSNEYTLGRPRMVKDTFHPELMVTDPGQDNAQLVSPSFMIGSCVGEFFVGGGNLKLDGSDKSVRVAREHCAHYVETYQDPKTGKTVTLDDWRLPTEAELKIIFKFQGSEDQDADAIDYRLNGQYYYSASGRFYNEKYKIEGTGVACVRDAYDKKK